MNTKYKKKLIILFIFIFICTLTLTHYKLWTMSGDKEYLAISTSDCIKTIYSDDQNILLVNPRALSDEDGNTTIPNTITVINNCSTKENITLYLDINDNTSIDDNKMKISINGDEELKTSKLDEINNIINSNDNKTYKLISFDLNINETKRINFRLWLDENSALSDDKNTFAAKYYISDNNKKSFKETILENNKDYVNESNYLKGDTTNNNFKFANLNWKIIGINKDNSIRLLYAENNLESKYNEFSNQDKNVAFEESTIKEYLNNFYNEKLIDYDKYIVESSYCNDTSFIRSYRYTYGSFIRTIEEHSPSVECKDPENSFGGQISSKIALLTMDEAATIKGELEDSYLNSGVEYFTMSPAIYNGRAYVGVVDSNGNIDATMVSDIKNVKPVINVKGSILVKGDGSNDNPFVIE